MKYERIEQLWMSENGLEDCQLCVRADFQKAAKFFEAEVRKEQAEKIATLERELCELQTEAQADLAERIEITKLIRAQTGYDGYNDQEGIDLAGELQECFEMADAEHERELAEARKDSEILNEFLTGKPFTVKMKKSTVTYGPNPEADFASAFREAIKAKEQPNG